MLSAEPLPLFLTGAWKRTVSSIVLQLEQEHKKIDKINAHERNMFNDYKSTLKRRYHVIGTLVLQSSIET